MPRQSATPTPGQAQEFFLNLYDQVAVDLHVYCETVGARKTETINRAVEAYIHGVLDANAGFRLNFEERKQRFLEEARRLRQADRSARLRVVTRRGGQASQTKRRSKAPANSEDR